MNNPILKRIGFVLIFLAGIGIGASALWLEIQNNSELQYFLLEQPGGNSPQTKVATFAQSIVQGDQTAALKLWAIYDKLPPARFAALDKRREYVISDLLSAKIKPGYMILGVEWWTTCCEPGVTNDSRNAGGARIQVQFLDKMGAPIVYIFDIFTREQPYWGDAEGYLPRDWIIRDIYSQDKKPLFWTLVYEPQIQSIQSAAP
jgi:hypothetical protein